MRSSLMSIAKASALPSHAHRTPTAPSPSAPTRASTAASRQSSRRPSIEMSARGMPAQRLPPPADRAGPSAVAGGAGAGVVTGLDPVGSVTGVVDLGPLDPHPSANAQRPIHFMGIERTIVD